MVPSRFGNICLQIDSFALGALILFPEHGRFEKLHAGDILVVVIRACLYSCRYRPPRTAAMKGREMGSPRRDALTASHTVSKFFAHIYQWFHGFGCLADNHPRDYSSSTDIYYAREIHVQSWKQRSNSPFVCFLETCLTIFSVRAEESVVIR